VVFAASRYQKGNAAYLNCPLNKEEYERFWSALVGAERFQRHPFEEGASFFESCLPVEELARRGPDTLRFGPLRPVGLYDPCSRGRPYAVVQLRPKDRAGHLYNMVGFQTGLRQAEQRRVFRLIPGLAAAHFVRYGAMHRNTFLNAPRTIFATLQARVRADLFFAGQITGVEGYVESAAAGLVAGLNAARLIQRRELVRFPKTIAIGALLAHLEGADPDCFQPMNVNFGLLESMPDAPRRRRDRNRALAERALGELQRFANIANLSLASTGRVW
jgi:methylenetetrahydrofolate--tRNA-(uracil-5-)-methyltransferase